MRGTWWCRKVVNSCHNYVRTMDARNHPSPLGSFHWLMLRTVPSGAGTMGININSRNGSTGSSIGNLGRHESMALLASAISMKKFEARTDVVAPAAQTVAMVEQMTRHDLKVQGRYPSCHWYLVQDGRWYQVGGFEESPGQEVSDSGCNAASNHCPRPKVGILLLSN